MENEIKNIDELTQKVLYKARYDCEITLQNIIQSQQQHLESVAKAMKWWRKYMRITRIGSDFLNATVIYKGIVCRCTGFSFNYENVYFIIVPENDKERVNKQPPGYCAVFKF